MYNGSLEWRNPCPMVLFQLPTMYCTYSAKREQAVVDKGWVGGPGRCTPAVTPEEGAKMGMLDHGNSDFL